MDVKRRSVLAAGAAGAVNGAVGLNPKRAYYALQSDLANAGGAPRRVRTYSPPA